MRMKMCADAVIAPIQWSPFFLAHQCVDHQPGGKNWIPENQTKTEKALIPCTHNGPLDTINCMAHT